MFIVDTVFIVGVVIGALFLGYVLVKSRYKKAGPDEALVVFGRRKLLGQKVVDDEGRTEGFRILHGGGTFIWPGWESFERLSLKMMTLEINMPHVYTEQGIPINVKAVAQVKVRASTEFIKRAGEAFLGVDPKEVQATIQETVAGHLRGIIGTLTIEALYRDQKSFQDKVRDEAHADLAAMGFEFKSFVFQEIQDEQGYLDALGQPKIQEALKRARIATANADRDAKIEEESARRAKEEQRLNVDREIAEADKQLSLKKASIQQEVDVAKAQAQKSGEMEIKRRSGLLSHSVLLYDELTAEENLRFFARLYGVADPRSRSRELLDDVGLSGRADDPVGTFSRGMQQRLSIARSLIHEPSLVLLDEPFAGLDARAADALRGMLARLREEGRTVLLATHDLTTGLDLSDRWIVIDRGRVVDGGGSGDVDRDAFATSYRTRFDGAGSSAGATA